MSGGNEALFYQAAFEFAYMAEDPINTSWIVERQLRVLQEKYQIVWGASSNGITNESIIIIFSAFVHKFKQINTFRRVTWGEHTRSRRQPSSVIQFKRHTTLLWTPKTSEL